MAQQRSIEIKVGLFVLICLVVAAAMILKFGKYTRVAEHTYNIDVVFANVGGIVKDASVMLAGISVGKVSGITLDEDPTGKMQVKLKLTVYQGVKIRKDAKFVINQAGLLGDRYVDVIPQSGTAALIQDGDVVAGSPSVDLSEAIRGVVNVLQQAAGTIERVDKAIQRIDQTVLARESLDHISSVMANIDTTSSNAAAFTADLRSLVETNRESVNAAIRNLADAAKNFDAVLNKASATADSIGAASKHVDEVIAQNKDEINAAAKSLAGASQSLSTILTRLEKGEGTAGKLLIDPALHDELLQLVQNWRRYGLLYKEGTPRETKQIEKRGKLPEPNRPAGKSGDTLIFGTDLTKPGQ